MVYVFLAEGFEIIEALAPVDMLRRAKIDVRTVGVTGKIVSASCGISVEADISISDFIFKDVEAIVLPGGMPGTLNLEKNEIVQATIDKAMIENKLVCAICAAPSILGHKDLLVNKEATCFPGFEDALNGAKLSQKYVIKDGNIITARGAGVCIDFGLEIVKSIKGESVANDIKSSIQCQ